MGQEERLEEQLGDDHAVDDGFDSAVTDDPEESEQDSEELGEDEAIDTSEFDSAMGELVDAEELEIVDELPEKEQNARSLATRRAIEQRMEEKQLQEDLDYLDLDLAE
tara:strand:+ start:5963 stop:6286 length:324 start_codon:yes stop_codon:yes gene_type:complete